MSFSFRAPTPSSVSSMYLLIHKNRRWRRRFMTEMSENRAYATILAKKPATPGDLPSLEKAPAGSLGHTYAAFMKNHQLSLPVPVEPVPDDDFHYCVYRILNTHDLYHVLLDTVPDSYGEMVVASFTNAQIPLYLHPSTHIAGSLAYAAFNRNTSTRFLIRGCAVGHLLGLRSQPLFNVDWDTLWHLPLPEARQKLGINIPEVESLVDTHTPGSPRLKLPTLYEMGAHKAYYYERRRIGDQYVHLYTPRVPTNGLCLLGRAMFTKGDYFHPVERHSLTAALLGAGWSVAIPVPCRENSGDFDKLAKSQLAVIRELNNDGFSNLHLIGHSFSGVLYTWLCREYEELPVKGVATIACGLWIREAVKTLSRKERHHLMRYNIQMRVLQAAGRKVASRQHASEALSETKRLVRQVVQLPWKGKTLDPDNILNRLERQNPSHTVPCLSLAGNGDKMMPPSLVSTFHSRFMPHANQHIYPGAGHMNIVASDHYSGVWHTLIHWLQSGKTTEKNR
ncbi:Coq4 family protein [Microbulbifer halophilus]|uniref:Coq4 family protein n=1 Tax=Microbulbifer halophilus TaxID=453963 RepID=A0ABW5E7K8_9GAMM|nr:Coq4 family protein [Microbulbifer halophilus]MCW8125302.1 Coq4 family protein [Microbulbifer halophilus]